MSGLPLAVTMGEPAGIGGELTLKAWHDSRTTLPPYFAVDDPGRLARLAETLGLAVPIATIAGPEEAAAVFPRALPVLPMPLARPVVPGRLEPANAPAVIGAIDRAVALAMAGRAAGIVTQPIHKKVLLDAGFQHPGHTEYLAALAGDGHQAVMMLTCPGLRVVPLTVHMPLAKVAAAIDRAGIERTALIVLGALRRDYGIVGPRLAVAGLNPHAGEGGALGHEEGAIIGPAVAALRQAGHQVSDPAPADSLFHAEARARYDAVLCMYHDQALIPLKTIDFAGGVNVTLGLPFVRTSPDHGTALDVAGRGVAFATSFVAALREAAAIAACRRAHG